MSTPKELYYEKRAQILSKNLKSRNFDACYCKNAEEALRAALAMIPEGATVGWGGAESAKEIGLLDAVEKGNYRAMGRDDSVRPDVFIAGANAISMDGQMVNIDGRSNRVSSIIYGPKTVIIIAGMNKVVDTLDDAMRRAKTVAAPMNEQRFLKNTPCAVTGACADCKNPDCICCNTVITRFSREKDRIRFVLVGQDLGF